MQEYTFSWARQRRRALARAGMATRCVALAISLFCVGWVPAALAQAAKASGPDLARSYDSLPKAERRAALTAIAEESFAILIEVMPTGLRKSVRNLERVARYRDWLDASREPRARLLALSLQQGVDRAVIVELYRAAAEKAGSTPGYSVTPNSVDGELAAKRLAANWFDPEAKLDYALALDGICARSAKSQGWRARDFLRGNASLAGVIFGYEKELAATRDTLLSGAPNLALSDAEIADQLLAATVFAIDRGRDVRIFASIHRDLSKLPKDRAEFDAAVKRALAASPYFHLLTADPAQMQDIEFTMRNYAHPARKAFVKNLAPALVPFVSPDYELPADFFHDDPKFAGWRGLWLPQ